MLSGETAAGKYPVEAVKTMADIAEYTEGDIDYEKRFREQTLPESTSLTNAISHASGLTAIDISADAIITVTQSGYTARMISKFKPSCPIVGCTPSVKTYYQLGLVWGVTPEIMEHTTDSELLLNKAFNNAIATGFVRKGRSAVLTAGLPLGTSAKTNTIRVMMREGQ